MEKVKSRLRQTAIVWDDSVGPVLNREIVPTISELVRRFNALPVLGNLVPISVSSSVSLIPNTLYDVGTLAAPITLTLPASPDLGDFVHVKVTNAAAQNVTLSGPIDGAASLVLNTNYASRSLYWNGSEWRVL